jgi:hypothetical protein
VISAIWALGLHFANVIDRLTTSNHRLHRKHRVTRKNEFKVQSSRIKRQWGCIYCGGGLLVSCSRFKVQGTVLGYKRN